MHFDPPLIEGVLLRRYKRFLADVALTDGSVITAHTPNTGSMLGCCAAGSRVWLRDSNNLERKYRHTWEIVEVGGVTPVGINTGLVNRLVIDAIDDGVIAPLQGYARIRQEVKYGHEGSRIDLLLEGGEDGRDCYVEIKNVTACDESGRAIFPDAVTSRGTKHLRELAAMAQAGHRAVIFFCIQRGDVDAMRPADEIDPEYGRTLRRVVTEGVEAMAYVAEVSPSAVRLTREVGVMV